MQTGILEMNMDKVVGSLKKFYKATKQNKLWECNVESRRESGNSYPLCFFDIIVNFFMNDVQLRKISLNILEMFNKSQIGNILNIQT